MEKSEQKINLLIELDLAVESRISSNSKTASVIPVTIENYSRDLDFAISQPQISALLKKVISIHGRSKSKVSIYLTNSTDNCKVTMKIKSRTDMRGIGPDEIEKIEELARSCRLDYCQTTKDDQLTTVLTFKRNN